MLKSGSNRDKRALTIVDETEMSIIVTLWGTLANQHRYEVGQIIAFKNASISDFGGKSINCGDDRTQIIFEPNHPRTLLLQKWNSMGAKHQIQSLSSNLPGAGGEDRDNFRLIEEIEEHCRQSQALKVDRGQEFFKISGYISRIMYDDMRMMFYLACPDCKKKVLEEAGGFRCETCNKVHQTCNTNYVYTARINDFTGC